MTVAARMLSVTVPDIGDFKDVPVIEVRVKPGDVVKITPLSPDDPIPDLEERLAALHALGPMQFEPGEQEAIAADMAQLNALSKAAIDRMSSDVAPRSRSMVEIDSPFRSVKAFSVPS